MIPALLAVAVANASAPYVAAAPALDLARILPAPPAPGSAEQAADRRIFAQTRALAGTRRWQIARADAGDELLTVFGCALGIDDTHPSMPALSRLLDRLSSGGAVDLVKALYAVRRPFLDQRGPICEPRTIHLAENGDYPSGHTTAGWAAALVLAEVAPDRATIILRRGRQFGESRFICGSHSRSAVEAGYLAGAAIVAVAHAAPDFAVDLAAARAELAHRRGASPQCDARQAGIATR